MAGSLLRTDKEITELYQRHAATVYRVCFTYLKNTADTEDMVQNTFLRLLSHPVEFNSAEHEKAWLIVTAANLCKDFLRSWWRKREPLEESSACAPPFAMDETLSAVLRLPDKYKAAVYLYYYEGYTGAEIAGLLHKPPSTIRTYLSKGRALLRTTLGGDFHEE